MTFWIRIKFCIMNSLVSEVNIPLLKQCTIFKFVFFVNALENNTVPLTVFVDFCKAFDTINFNTLLSRLSGIGLDSACVKWFSSYLHAGLSKLLCQIY